MPGRYIREGLLDSERFDLLRKQGGAAAQLFFTLLLLVVDDYGRCKNHAVWLKSKVFPLRGDVREPDIARWLAACEKSGLLVCYDDRGGNSFVQVFNFGQQARSKSKYPDPPAEILQAMQSGSFQSSAMQNNAKHCKTKFSPNDNDNDNDNESVAHAQAGYPGSADEIIAIAAKAGDSLTRMQAEKYLAVRQRSGWMIHGKEKSYKLPPAGVRADVHVWALEDARRAASAKTQKTQMVENTEAAGITPPEYNGK